MTAIVMNTATGAVSESDWAFTSISALHATDAGGLYTLGGDNDNGAPITGEIRSGKPCASNVQVLGNVFLGVKSEGNGTLIVSGRTQDWEYPVAPRTSGVSSVMPGKGIRESYLGFGYRNAAGASFRLDRIDAEVTPSTTRRK